MESLIKDINIKVNYNGIYLNLHGKVEFFFFPEKELVGYYVFEVVRLKLDLIRIPYYFLLNTTILFGGDGQIFLEHSDFLRLCTMAKKALNSEIKSIKEPKRRRLDYVVYPWKFYG